jgi:dinuclear metal center YbgI/SA1388 family protein
MTHLIDLTTYLHTLLDVDRIPDYCPNGLQVLGRPSIQKIVTGVTACQDLLDAALAAKADALLVHHGYFWKGEDPCITGIKQKRLQTLLQNEISLLAYHLPLDIHPIYGNNAQLGKLLGIPTHKRFSIKGGLDLLCLGKLETPCRGADFAQQLQEKLHRKPLHITKTNKLIRSLAWCTGAAQDFIEAAIAQGADAYLTGEISERTVHIARESNIHLFAAGHHASERYGVIALGEHLAQQFPIEHQFIDVDNPV